MIEEIIQPQFIMNVYLHSLILFTLLSVLFIFIISKMTSEIFSDEITHLMKETLTKKIGKFVKEYIKNEQDISELEDKLERLKLKLDESKLEGNKYYTRFYLQEINSVKNKLKSSDIRAKKKFVKDNREYFENCMFVGQTPGINFFS